MKEPSCFLITLVVVKYVSSEINSGLNFGYIPNFVGVGGTKLPVVSA